MSRFQELISVLNIIEFYIYYPTLTMNQIRSRYTHHFLSFILGSQTLEAPSGSEHSQRKKILYFCQKFQHFFIITTIVLGMHRHQQWVLHFMHNSSYRDLTSFLSGPSLSKIMCHQLETFGKLNNYSHINCLTDPPGLLFNKGEVPLEFKD